MPQSNLEKAVSFGEPWSIDHMFSFHTTKAKNVSNILDRDEIFTQFDDFLSKNAAFFFLGKPAYRVSDLDDTTKIALNQLHPVCFVLDLTDSTTLAFPFDTGAFRKLQTSIPGLGDLGNFSLSVHNQSHFLYLGCMFTSLTRYLNAEPNLKTSAEIADGHLEFRQCQDIVTSYRDYGLDDRAATMELHTISPPRLTNSLKAVIAPRSVLNNQFKGTRIGAYLRDTLDVECRGYDSYPTLTPNEHMSQIYHEARTLFS